MSRGGGEDVWMNANRRAGVGGWGGERKENEEAKVARAQLV